MSTLKEALGAMVSGQRHLCQQQGQILDLVSAIRDWQIRHDRDHQESDVAACARRESTADQRKKCAVHFARIERALDIEAAADSDLAD